MKINDYYNRLFSKKEIKQGAHRDGVGGMWEELGKLQFEFLLERGLKPPMKLIDIGCGSLRGGVRFVEYLDKGNYYGIDVNKSLLDAGYGTELALKGLQAKLPCSNLLVEDRFRVSRFGVEFDFALAQSVFTHLPLNHVRLCLIEVSKCLKRSGRFYATFFEVPDGAPVEKEFFHSPGGVTTYPHLDPYHYRQKDFSWASEGLGLEFEYIGDWGHPRAQKMLCFTRLD